MAVPVIETYTDISHAGTSFDVTKPTGLAVGDLLLAIISKDDDITMSPPGTWGTAFDGSKSAAQACASFCFYKVADSTDVAASVFTFTGDNEDYVGRLYRISGADTTSPIDQAGTGQVGTSATPQALSLDTNNDNALCFAFTGMDDNDVPYTLETAGWTEDVNTDATTTGIVIGYKSLASAGATGVVNFTTNASDGWVAAQVAIKEAGAVTTTITPGSASLTTTGLAPEIINDVAVEPSSAAITATGQVTTILVSVNISAGFASVTAEGFIPNIDLPVDVEIGSGVLSIAGFEAAVDLPVDIEIGSGSATVVGAVPSVLLSSNIAIGSADITTTGQVPTTVNDVVISPASSSITTTGQAPSTQFDIVVSPNSSSITSTGQEPVVQNDVDINPANGSVTATGQVTVIVIQSDIDISPNSASITTTGQVPAATVASTTTIEPGSASITAAGAAPSIAVGQIYSTDFSEYTTGVDLSDWTEYWAVGNLTYYAQTNSGTHTIGTNWMDVVAVLNKTRVVTWDDIGSVADCDILTNFKCIDGGHTTANGPKVYARVGGAETTEDAYALNVAGATVSLEKFTAGTQTVLDSEILAIKEDGDYWVRFQVIGNNLKGKVWDIDSVEPADWLIETSDTTHSSGYVGVGGLSGITDFQCDYFECATGDFEVSFPPAGWESDTKFAMSNIDTKFTNVDRVYMAGGLFVPEGRVLTGMRVRVLANHTAQLRCAVYSGGSLVDGTEGATLLHDFGLTTGTDVNTWLELSGANVTIPANEPLWVCVKGDDDGFTMAKAGKGNAGNYQVDRGTYIVTVGISSDETVAWPSTVPTITTDAWDTSWYYVEAIFEDPFHINIDEASLTVTGKAPTLTTTIPIANATITSAGQAPTVTGHVQTFTTDFSEYTTGVNLSDWTDYWGAGWTTWKAQVNSGDPKAGTKWLDYYPTIGGARRAITWDTVGDVEDSDALMLLSAASTGVFFSASGARFYARVSGSAPTENAYFVSITDNVVRIDKYVNRTYSNIVTVDLDALEAPHFWLRFKVEGTSLKAKVWAAESVEPVDWLLEGTDSSHTSGYCGIGGYDVVNRFKCDYYSVAVNGGNIDFPFDGWEDATKFGSFNREGLWTNVNTVLMAGGQFNSENKVLTGMRVRVGTSHSGQVRCAVYSGGSLSNPEGATLLHDFGLTTGTGINQWLELTGASAAIPVDEPLWTCIKCDDGAFSAIKGQKGNAGNHQVTRGTIYFSDGIDPEETVAWPSTVPAVTENESPYYYMLEAVFEESDAIAVGSASVVVTGQVPTIDLIISTVTPGSASITLTGQAPTIDNPVGIDIPNTTITATGQVPIIVTVADVDIPIGNATITLTGQAPTADNPVVVEPANGTITLTGQAPVADNPVGIDIGSVAITLTGQAPAALVSQNIDVGSASITLTGQVPEIDNPVTVEPSNGSITLTGQAPEIDNPVGVDVANASITLTGQVPATDISADVTIPVGSATITVTGQAPTADNPVAVDIASASITLTGQVTIIILPQTIDIGSATITLTGQAPTADNPVNVDIASATITVTGQAPTADNPVGIDVASASVTLTGQAPTIQVSAGVDIPIGSASITLAGQVPVADNPVNVDIGSAAITLTGQVTDVLIPQIIEPANGTITLTGQVPTADNPVTVEPPAGAVTLSGHAPVADISADVSVPIPTGTITVSGNAPDIIAPLQIQPGNGSIIVAGQTPVASVTVNVDITVPSGTVTLTGQQPVANNPVQVQTGNGSIVATGQVATVVNDVVVSIGNATITLTGFAPTQTTTIPVGNGTIDVIGQLSGVSTELVPIDIDVENATISVSGDSLTIFNTTFLEIWDAKSETVRVHDGNSVLVHEFSVESKVTRIVDKESILRD